QQRILFRMDLRFLLEKQLDAAVYEQRAKNIDDPVKLPDQANTQQNKHRPHHQRAQNPPEQNLVLMFTRDFEEAEDQQEHEQVIDAQRQLDHIAGYELQRGRASMPEEHDEREDRRHGNPHHAPDRSLAKLYRVRLAVKHTQVQRQHHGYKHVEKNPEQ